MIIRTTAVEMDLPVVVIDYMRTWHVVVVGGMRPLHVGHFCVPICLWSVEESSHSVKRAGRSRSRPDRKSDVALDGSAPFFVGL